jgi:sodium/potassium-transporting ATPase subunit alpha
MTASGNHSQLNELEASAVFTALASRPSGLTAAETTQRRVRYGWNRLQSASHWRWIKALGKQFLNFFSILLDVAAAACFVANAIQPGEGMGVLGWALLSVSLLNALFSFGQEMRAERAMEELRRFLPQFVRVRRDGIARQVPAEELVPGDVLLLGEGDRIPADARLVEAEGLLVNNAPLTGESRSQALTSAPSKGQRIDSRNIAFAGCSVLRGSGTAVVVATAHHTEFGKIAALSRDVRRPQSPIERETSRMIRILTIIAVAMGTAFFLYGVVTGRSFWVNLVFMLGIIVANVPEGLLPTLTLALSMASLRMAKKQVLVKSLQAVEALGAVHVICTDKTGTLTKNELAITSAVDPLTGLEQADRSLLHSCFKGALIASEVRPAPAGTEATAAWFGDPLDVAIAARYAELFVACDRIISETRRHFPFDLQKRRQAGLYANGDEVLFAVKGAWESVRPLVGSIQAAERAEPIPISPAALAKSDEVVEQLTRQGLRVIAVATSRLPALPSRTISDESLEKALVLRGFLALDDPLRPEVPAAVETCHRAGVRVVMITGDHPNTAAAIAKRCGIVRPDQSLEGLVVLGSELEQLAPENVWRRLQAGATIFARTTPEQKMKIVEAWKQNGHTVAMTGDGVNDAPALKAAAVGIAMGVSGTDVAREAAGIVLLDDNFASIVAGIEEGRAVFANIQKFTTYVLASNIPEIAPFLLYILLPVPLALTVVQILSIDLGTDLLPAIGLGQEPPEPDVMQRPPRQPQERLLSRSLMLTAYLFLGVIQAGWSLGLFFLVLVRGGWHWGVELSVSDPLYRSATGITLSSIVIMQIANVIGRRSLRGSGVDAELFRNRLLWLGIAVEVTFSWAILYCPPLRQFLGTGPVSWQVYALAWLGIPLLYLLDLARKQLSK